MTSGPPTQTALDYAHTSLARHSWWSGVSSPEAARAGEIVSMLGGNVMSPFYWWRLTDTFTGPGTILVEYLCVRSHDIIADPETFLDIVRISD